MKNIEKAIKMPIQEESVKMLSGQKWTCKLIHLWFGAAFLMSV
jgi:hypothetical protein